MSEQRYTTHPKAVAGIVLMASLMLFAFLFWVVIGLAALVAPMDTDVLSSGAVVETGSADYLSTGRVILATVVASLGTFIFWKTTD